MKKLIGIIVTVAMLATLALPAFAASEPSLEPEVKTLNTEAVNDTLQSNIEKASDKASKADRAVFKGVFKDLFDKLNGLRATASKNWEAIKAINAKIKPAMTAYKESLKTLTPEERKAKIQAMQAILKPLHATVKSIHGEIKVLREAKKAEWVKFRAAVKARDKNAAETALTSIISLKSQIIEKQGPLLEAKTAILNALTAK